MADEKTILTYKGRPLMRKDNLVYYGSMADSHIVMLQILETKKVGEADVASKVSVELQLTDPNVRARDRIVKKGEKDGFFTALDLGSVWLARALKDAKIIIDPCLNERKPCILSVRLLFHFSIPHWLVFMRAGRRSFASAVILRFAHILPEKAEGS